MLQYLHFEDRETWLAGRVGLGASDAAAVCGLSKWQTPLGLWEIKTGRKKAKDLSGNAAVSFGVRAEPHLRGLFLAEHPEYQLEYHPFDILYQEERPWLTATLDGELITETGEHGVLEIKTAQCSSKEDWAEWRDRTPTHYYTQICHQFLATGYSFAFLFALLTGLDGSSSLRTYYFTAESCADDMAWLLDKEEAFWKRVQAGTMPPAVLKI